MCYTITVKQKTQRLFDDFRILLILSHMMCLYIYIYICNLHLINQGIIGEWQMLGNFDYRTACINVILDKLFIDFRVIFCGLFTSYTLSYFCFGCSNVLENVLVDIT